MPTPEPSAEPSPHESSSVDPEPGFAWVVAAAVAFLLLTALPSFWPSGFSDDPLPLLGRGAIGLHFVIMVGLLAGWRWMWFLALAYLGLGFGFWIAVAGDLLPPDPSPMQPYALGWGLLFALHVVAFSILAFVPSVRTYFASSSDSPDTSDADA